MDWAGLLPRPGGGEPVRQDAFHELYAPQEAFVAGNSPEARDASRTGAEAAEAVRSKNMAILLDLWRVPRSLQEVSALSGLPINSVCSLHAALRKDLVFAGYRIVARPTGRDTKQTRWVRK